MESRCHDLPPLKRFKLLQQNTHPKPQILSNHSCLPAKKRIESRDPSSIYCLPAKKRVWAPQPLSTPFNPINEEDPTQEQENPTKKIPSNSVYDNDFNNKIIHNTHFDDKPDEEDGVICSICQSTDGDPSDPIVFCDGCDLMVHASCYGNPLIQAIPEGDWYCSQCKLSKIITEGGEDFSCCLCPIKGGATKPTVDGRWAHVMCAILVPEVFFRDSRGREGIDCSHVPQRRWNDVCYICNLSSGCVMDCSEAKCSSKFHVSCGLKEELCIEYREGRTGAIVAGFCNIHTQLWKKQQLTGKFKIVPREKK